MAIRMPRLESSSNTRLACSRSAITSVSVTSSVSSSAGRVICLEVAGDAIDERAVSELPSRDVDGDAELQAGAPPVGQVGAGLGEDEVTDLADDTHLFGDGDELVRGNRTLFGMIPAGERLDLGDLVGADVPNGVVHDAQLGVGLEGVREQASEQQRSAHALVVLDRVHLDRGAALLGQVHRDVRPLEEESNLVPVVRSESDARTRSHRERQPIDLDRAGQNGVQLVDQRRRVLDRRDTGDDEGELVPSEASDGRLLRARPLEPLRDLEQKTVTDRVAQRVVHVLEAVDVEEDDGDARVLVQRSRGAAS